MVNIQLSLYGIKQIDQKNNKVQIKCIMRHKWTDKRLTWNPSDYGGTEITYMASTSLQKIWTPDLALRQMNGKMLFPGLDDTLIRLYHNGSIYWSRSGLLDLVHKFDLTKYPFDIQRIEMVVESWSNPTNRMRVRGWTNEALTMQKEPTFYSNKQWDLLSFNHTIKDIAYPSASYDSVTLTFRLKR